MRGREDVPWPSDVRNFHSREHGVVIIALNAVSPRERGWEDAYKGEFIRLSVVRYGREYVKAYVPIFFTTRTSSPRKILSPVLKASRKKEEQESSDQLHGLSSLHSRRRRSRGTSGDEDEDHRIECRRRSTLKDEREPEGDGVEGFNMKSGCIRQHLAASAERVAGRKWRGAAHVIWEPSLTLKIESEMKNRMTLDRAE
jgi:hypothetical protein